MLIQSFPLPGFSKARAVCWSPDTRAAHHHKEILVAIAIEIGERDAVALWA